ncbi:hypothetical protein N7539_004568 [Penicillium diatomitis]|uniref:ATP phosphoribosyltransferase n=1 Tax=Penicillium diatomitis TaxID=2819901 RepID=A0A9W9XEQ7_9EURO|nr:uncharacterized protein N7539_004568 [Penicillium diatomitis]KAJ5489678.1 hypothetical protein N7539_004568 [Penicillium diatomitis]
MPSTTTPSTTPSSTPQYKLIFRVPPSHLEPCKQAVFDAGAGAYPGGMYADCCWEVLGMDQFRPTDKASPFIGQPGRLERVAEYRVETLCVGEDVMRESVKALRKVHPYEQIVIEVVQLIDIDGKEFW